ncbi:hypothetical protein [Geobacter sp. SVR]|uniref:hypothetical protein n=1 Tax=Geobacter sp. SVR TaxID=2495594 RepID=UPI001EF1A73D|nr:hypothetical protein [Geobacter sp. SVR]
MERENGKAHVSSSGDWPLGRIPAEKRPAMKSSPTRRDRLAALKIVSAYALFGGLWIFFSDTVLKMLNNDLSVMTNISLIKGNIFILLTSLLLYKLIIRHILQSRDAISSLEHTEQALQSNRQELASLVETLEERVRQTVDELRQKDQLLIQQNRMAAMGEMLCNIAHHWRQPLNVLGLKLQDLVLSHEHGVFSKELLESNIPVSDHRRFQAVFDAGPGQATLQGRPDHHQNSPASRRKFQ